MKTLLNLFTIILTIVLFSCTKSDQLYNPPTSYDSDCDCPDTTLIITDVFVAYPTYMEYLQTPSINISDVMIGEHENADISIMLQNDSLNYSREIYHKYISTDAYRLKVVGITSKNGFYEIYEDTALTKSYYIELNIRYTTPDYSIRLRFNDFTLE